MKAVKTLMDFPPLEARPPLGWPQRKHIGEPGTRAISIALLPDLQAAIGGLQIGKKGRKIVGGNVLVPKQRSTGASPEVTNSNRRAKS